MPRLTAEIFTPEKPIFKDEVASVIVPAAHGLMEVLPGHTPLVAALTDGEVTLRLTNKQTMQFVIAGGFIEALPTVVRLYLETADLETTIDEKKAELELQRAKAKLQQKDLNRESLIRAKLQVQKELSKIKVLRRKKSSK